ncbi:nascent polypeptide-associated complex subunit alpha, muscle-specific form [Nymphalis io]|uniref:nascent polypeptide-associated complex subunit alpha, muscle-specific form n=1 Tax=Inachis io TaxID=171585 RepID=UPI0021681635|nr:nascent polypeptide-associated complex subunit alpha, muscle-specific form [Nymphalis io]
MSNILLSLSHIHSTSFYQKGGNRLENISKMTSTSFNVGLGDGSRSSSRVLRPPGGGHTDIFGGEPEPTRGRRPAPSAAASLIQGQGDEPAKPTNGAITPSQNGQASEPHEAPAPPAPVPETAQAAPVPQAASTPQAAPTPTTPPEPKSMSPKAVTPTEPRCEAPKRVRVPPGGFSSGLW